MGVFTTITNSYTPEVRNIKVNKFWYDEDNLYQVRAKEVKVDIIADGKVIKTITLNDAKGGEEPPKTSDSISLSVIMLILSSGIFTTCVFVKKNSNI